MFNFNLTHEKRQTPEAYTQKLQEALPGRLISVVLYGSAASGDYQEGRSDYNVMVMVPHWGVLELNLIAKVTQQWVKEGNPPPLLFTEGRLQSAADCYPIEMLDMKQSYKILYGEDVLKEVKVQAVHLRLIVEREIKSLNIGLRQSFVLAMGQPEKVGKILIETLSSILVVLRAALRLHTNTVPAKKHEVPGSLAQYVEGIDLEAFEKIRQLKAGTLKLKGANSLQLFDRVMISLQAVGHSVDGHVRNG